MLSWRLSYMLLEAGQSPLGCHQLQQAASPAVSGQGRPALPEGVIQGIKPRLPQPLEGSQTCPEESRQHGVRAACLPPLYQVLHVMICVPEGGQTNTPGTRYR